MRATLLKIAARTGIRRLTNQRQPVRFSRMMGFLHNLHGQRADRRGVAQVIDKIQRPRASSAATFRSIGSRRSVAGAARPSPEKARQNSLPCAGLKRSGRRYGVSLATSWACKNREAEARESNWARLPERGKVLHRRCAVASKTEDSIAAHPASASGSKASFNGKRHRNGVNRVAGNACAS